MDPSFFDRVYAVVRKIPRGKVAPMARSRPCSVTRRPLGRSGWALNALRGSEIDDVPWQRVINSAGRISISRVDLGADLQRATPGRGRGRVRRPRLRGSEAIWLEGDGQCRAAVAT